MRLVLSRQPKLGAASLPQVVMLVEILVLLVALVLGGLACIRVWLVRKRRQPLDPGSSVGFVPGPGNVGGAP